MDALFFLLFLGSLVFGAVFGSIIRYKIFKKAGRSAWSSLNPFRPCFIIPKIIIGKRGWWFIGRCPENESIAAQPQSSTTNMVGRKLTQAEPDEDVSIRNRASANFEHRKNSVETSYCQEPSFAGKKKIVDFNETDFLKGVTTGQIRPSRVIAQTDKDGKPLLRFEFPSYKVQIHAHFHDAQMENVIRAHIKPDRWDKRIFGKEAPNIPINNNELALLRHHAIEQKSKKLS